MDMLVTLKCKISLALLSFPTLHMQTAYASYRAELHPGLTPNKCLILMYLSAQSGRAMILADSAVQVHRQGCRPCKLLSAVRLQ